MLKLLPLLILVAIVAAFLAVVCFYANVSGLALASMLTSSMALITLAAVVFRLGPRNLEPHQAGKGKPGEAEHLATIAVAMRGLTHECRNVLQQSQACLELLALKTRDRADVQDLVNDIQKALDRLHQLYEEASKTVPAVSHDRGA